MLSEGSLEISGKPKASFSQLCNRWLSLAGVINNIIK